MGSPIDFDGDALKLFRSALEAAEEHQDPRDQQYGRDYQNYHAVLDMSQRNPDRSNVTIPKIRSIVNTKAPGEIKHAVGSRPYIPFTARRQDFSEFAESQSKILDYHLENSSFFVKFVLGAMMNINYGTAFMESTPFFKNEVRRVPMPIYAETPFGPQIADWTTEIVPIRLLGLKQRVWAPWEIKVDPIATGLEEADECRYVIKIQITSKREIRKLAEAGGYPGLDLQELDDLNFGQEISENKGLQILAKMGIPTPQEDSDIAVLFRYESPERYIDVLDDQLVIRDTPNPYDKMSGGHGLINLSKMIHDMDPHTQAAFWGNGEGKSNEIQQSLLNDLWNLAIDNNNFSNQGMTYYAKGRGVEPEQLVHAVGNKVAFTLNPNERIGDVVQDVHGQGLPTDYYALLQRTEDYMDLTAQSPAVQRGETTGGDQTLGEISMLGAAADSRQELNIRLIESFLGDHGRKNLAHLDQFGRFDDRVEVLGREEAQRLILLNPRDLPGGYDFAFKGSDRVVNQLIRQRNLTTLDARLQGSPFLKERPWLKLLLEAHDLNEEAELVLKTDEEVQIEQSEALLQQLQIDNAGGGGGNPQLPAPNTTANNAQAAGRANTQPTEASLI